MLRDNLYRYVILKGPNSAYGYCLRRWAHTCKNREIVDYATTRTMAHNLTIDYQTRRDTGQPFPQHHSDRFYHSLKNGAHHCWAFRNNGFEFAEQCNREAERQFYEHLRARQEIRDDLWRAQNRDDFMAGLWTCSL